MTKLARVVQKIFGVNSGAKGTVAFGTAQNIIQGITPTYTKDISLIQNANFETGWGSAVPDNYAPFREDKTSVEMVLSRQLAYLYETGLAEYDATTNYCIGAECCVIDNLGNKSVYKSVIADNLGNAVSNTAYWTKLFEINASGVITYINNIFAPTPASGTNNTQVATTAFVNTALLGLMPTGVILPYGGETAPTGYLLCNGGAISRTTYSALFSVIGTAYGAGDGNTTFNLPNQTDKVFNDTLQVKGDGKALGLTDGGTLFGACGFNNTDYIHQSITAYGKNVGTGGLARTNLTSVAFGVTTDASKSGIVAVLSSPYQTNRKIIKY